jgi:hypothetical protein
MEEHVLGFTKLVNLLLGKPALALLAALHITPSNPEYPIPNHIAMEFLVFIFSIVFFLWLRARLSVDNPGATQQCMEALLHNNMNLGVSDLIDSNIGHGGERYLADDRLDRPVRADLEPDQPGAGPELADRGSFRAARLRDRGFRLLSLVRLAEARPDSLRRAFHGTEYLSFAADGGGRVGQPLGAAALAHRAFVGQHDGERNPIRFSWGSRWRFFCLRGTRIRRVTFWRRCRWWRRLFSSCCIFSWPSCRPSYSRFCRSFI